MKHLRFFVVLCLAAALFCMVPPAVADDWQPITPQDLKTTSADAGGADAIILFHEVTSDDIRKHRIEYERIKILTENGKKYADVVIPYGSEDHFETRIVDLKARTISPDGAITPFSGEVFDKTVVKAHGLRVKEKTLTLPDVRVGSIIEYRYSEVWSDEYVLSPRWIIQENLAQKRIKFSYIPLPADKQDVDIGNGDIADGVYHVEMGLPKGVTVSALNTRDFTMQLEMSNVPAYEEEEFSPPSEMMRMRVYFYYGNSKMLKPEEFWKQQGNHWSKEADKFIGHSSTVAQAAQAAVSPTDPPEQKARKLYALVQQMDNLSYKDRSVPEILTDRTTAAISAEQVLERKAGTHRDLTRLFVALLRSQNIPAYLMRVATREDTFFQPTVPEWRQLNSEVAIVTVSEGKEVFLDPGARLCSFGLLEWIRTGTQGVRQRSGGSTELAKTPPPSYSDAMTQRIADLTLDRDGNLKGKITLYWMGQQALRRRIEGSQTDDAGRKKAAEEELKSLLSTGAIVKNDFLGPWDDANKPLGAVFDVEIPGFASATGKRLLLPVALFEPKQPFVHQERKTPVYFDFPYRVVDKVVVHLPPDVQIENVPQSDPVKTDFAICNIQRSAKGDVLEFHRDFAIADVGFQLDEYPKVKSFFDKVHANDEEQVTLQTTPVAAGK